jgi:uncharacterized protein (TIGR03435 family)
MIRAFAIAGLVALSSAATFGQSFEVASVKVNTSGERPSESGKGDRLTMYNMPMRALIATAYQVPFDRVVGPNWLDTEGYDIVAKPAPDATREMLWPMLQNLLAERFKLAVHREQKVVPVWALVVGKQGPKLKESSDENQVKPGCGRQGVQLTCSSHRSTMARLAEDLHRWVSRDWFGLPIVDQTGLQGVYDFTLTWTPTPKPDEPGELSGVGLLDAIQDQLGLKLEPRKAPVDRIVIDHVERVPIEN